MDRQLFEKIPAHIWDAVGQLDLLITSEGQNPAIIDLLCRTTLLGGKRLRPLLTFLMADFFNLPSQKMTPYARAIELVHAASLAHDDVIDEATTRRGVESINVASSNKRAVLAGDYLLADVIVDMCRLGNIRLVSELSKVIKDLSDGEWLQMESYHPQNIKWEFIEQVALKKTASVMSWCCVAPAILAEAQDDIIEDCRSFGQELGLAFQFIDDTLDYLSVSETGKDSFQDTKNGVMNAVIFEYLKANLDLSFLSSHSSSPSDVLNYLSISLASASSSQFKMAADKVRGKAQKKLFYAKELMMKIRHSHPFRWPHEADKAMIPLFFVLDFLLERRK